MFYIVLAALFAICMGGLMWTIDDKVPKWLMTESRIGNSPGLGYRPISKNLTKGSLIWYDANNGTQVTEYTKLLDDFLDRKSLVIAICFRCETFVILSFSAYLNQTIKPRNNSMDCDFNNPPGPDFVCRVSLDNLGDCTAENSYGYNTSQPCVFLKLNRVNFLIIGIDPPFFSH